MVKLADPETGEYLAKEEFKSFRNSFDPNIGDIGVELAIKNNAVIVNSSVENSQASRAGIKFGDHIISINGENVDNKSLNQISGLLRGPVGSPISLQVKKFPDSGSVSLKLIREKLSAKIETLTKIENEILVLKINSFSQTSLKNIAYLFNNQQFDLKTKSLIIDLRDNSGGLLNTVIGLCSIFLPDNSEIGKTIGRKETIYRADMIEYFSDFPIKTEISSHLKIIPLAILINEGTIAGAEMVAITLKENNRATILGRNSFGRGSMQTVKQLGPDSLIKITTALWQTSNGATISSNGVTPHFYLDKKNSQIELFQALIKLKENRKF